MLARLCSPRKREASAPGMSSATPNHSTRPGARPARAREWGSSRLRTRVPVAVLVAKDVRLGLEVALQGGVAIEVVGHQVGDAGRGGAEADGLQPFQLEAGELQDDLGLGPDERELLQGRDAQVAGHNHISTGGPDDLADQGGGGGLAFGAGDAGDAGAGALQKEERHLHVYGDTVRVGHLQAGMGAGDGRVAHHEVGPGEVRLAVLAQDEAHVVGAQGLDGVGQALRRLEVGHGDPGPALGEEAGHAGAAPVDAEAHHQGVTVPVVRPLQWSGQRVIGRKDVATPGSREVCSQVRACAPASMVRAWHHGAGCGQ